MHKKRDTLCIQLYNVLLFNRKTTIVKEQLGIIVAYGIYTIILLCGFHIYGAHKLSSNIENIVKMRHNFLKVPGHLYCDMPFCSQNLALVAAHQ